MDILREKVRFFKITSHFRRKHNETASRWNRKFLKFLQTLIFTPKACHVHFTMQKTELPDLPELPELPAITCPERQLPTC